MIVERALQTELTRRRVLPLLGAALIAPGIACQNPRNEFVRSSEGRWSQAQVEAIAKAMQAEPEYNDIAFAGSHLQENQQGGPGISKLSPLFSDDKLKITTVASLPSPYGRSAGDIAALLIPVGAKEIVTMTNSSTQKPEFMSAADKKTMEILIATRAIKELSSFGLNFFVAKEVLNVKGYDMVTTYAFDNLKGSYSFPMDERSHRIIRHALVDWDLPINGQKIPISYMGDMWTQFLLSPNFLLARDNKRFTKDDMFHLSISEEMADFFVDRGTILRNDEGAYSWVQDKRKFDQDWNDLTGVLWTKYS